MQQIYTKVHTGINPTWLELKHDKPAPRDPALVGINPTWLELKLNSPSREPELAKGINPTWLELKHVGSASCGIVLYALILPGWN